MLKNYKEQLLAAAILLLTFLAFSSVLNHDFVDWDDYQSVAENPNVQALNGTTLKNMFSSDVIGAYIPLTTLSFSIEHALFGMKPGVFHTTNLLLHLICTLLVFILVRRLKFSLFVACVTALLFGIHPMRVESVAWITERKDLLYSLFFLLSLISYTSFLKTKKQKFYFLSLSLFVLSLLSKIQAVTLPLVLMLIDFLYEKRLRLRQLLNKIPFLVFSLITGIGGIILLSYEGTLMTDSVFSFFQRIFIGTYSLCLYLYKLIVPHPLSAIYPMPKDLNVLFYLSAMLVILMGWAIWKYTRNKPEWLFGILFFLLNMVFMLQILGAGATFISDRYTYLAYIGLFLLLARIAEHLLKTKRKTLLLVPGILWLVFLFIVTSAQAKVWENSERLFTHVIKEYPEVLIAHNNLGIYYRAAGRNDKAIEAYSKAISIKPDGYLAYSNRGELYFELGELKKALVDINQAIELKPDNSKALGNRAAIYGSSKQFKLALKDLEKALQIDPGNLRALSNQMLCHYSIGQYQEAVNDANGYLEVDPLNADILNQRGRCFEYLNRYQEALTDYNRAIELNPRKGNYYQNRSYLLNKGRRFKEALRDIKKAQQLGVKINPNYLHMLQSQ